MEIENVGRLEKANKILRDLNPERYIHFHLLNDFWLISRNVSIGIKINIYHRVIKVLVNKCMRNFPKSCGCVSQILATQFKI